MKFTSTTVKTAIGAAAIAAAGTFTAATAVAAPPTMGGFGASEQLVDGALITNYTVSNLQPSNTHYSRLYAAGTALPGQYHCAGQ